MTRILVELVDRSELTEPVILIADCGYEAYNNMAHMEQKYRWIPSKVHFDYIRDTSDALYPISFRVVRFAVKVESLIAKFVLLVRPGQQNPGICA